MSVTEWPAMFDEPADPTDVPEPPDGPAGPEVEPTPEELEPADLRLLVAGSAVGQRMAQIAISQRGVAESGGSNRGVPFERYVKPFGLTTPVPWCACFVSWCYLQTTASKPPWQNPAYVGSVYNWARAKGRLTRDPSQGDMFGISDQHMGLVAARLRNGRILTIEGNWGDRVLSRELPISGLWFATPTYP
jgi:hypothetical protein